MDVQELTLTLSDGAAMDFTRFGSGKKNFVIVAGMSLTGIRGFGQFIAAGYKVMTEDYTVYAFDRRRELREHFTVRDLAEDIADALGQLGVETADFMGSSLGGMIVQCLAMDHPGLVHAAVLSSTAGAPTPTAEENFPLWIAAAETRDPAAVNRVFYRRIWTDAVWEKNAKLLPALLRCGKPEDCPGFAELARACLDFDRSSELNKITCPVLVLGVRGDKVFSGEASEALAAALGCACFLYEGLGHSICDEAEDFKDRILRFYRAQA